MRARLCVGLWMAFTLCLALAACSGSPTSPPAPPPPSPLPANALPSIEAIAVQGRRPQQPARFADVRETVDVRATVRDAETPVEELTYEWRATAGTFVGTGANVTWTAPETVSAPTTVTITLKVIERYGNPGQPKNFSQDVSSTQTLSLHDSQAEVGSMAVRFLTEFSQPQVNKNVDDVMRDFKPAACPQPSLVEAEREDVIRHYTSFSMNAYTIDKPTVRIDFGEGCSFRGRPGDGCAIVHVVWDSTDTSKNIRSTAAGLDHIGAAYAVADSRWWLCSSDFESMTALGHQFYRR
jgi:hypothetical protein